MGHYNFSKTFFRDLVRDPTTVKDELQIDNSSMECALSILWRVVVWHSVEADRYSNDLEEVDKAKILIAGERLKRAFNGDFSYRINYIHFTPGNIVDFSLPEYYDNAYFYDRAVCGDVRVDDSGVCVFLKLPRVIFFIHADLEVDFGKVAPNPAILHHARIVKYLNFLVGSFEMARSSISERQVNFAVESISKGGFEKDWFETALRQGKFDKS